MKCLILSLLALGCGLSLIAAESDYLHVPVVKGIVFLKSMKELNEEGLPPLEGVQAKDLPLLQRADFARLMQKYLGKPLERETMHDLQTNVVLYYRRLGHPIVDVIYLDQEVKNNVLQVVVLEGKLVNKPVESHRYSYSSTNLWRPQAEGWTPCKYMQDQIRLRTSETVDARKLRRDLDWLNRNPLREVTVFFKPGAEPGESDAVLRSYEWNQPIQGMVGYEDSGTRITDLNRITAGFGWGKALGLTDHFMNYQFMADPELKHLRAHIGGYSIPLPWRHILRFQGYYLEAEGKIGNQGLVLKGVSYQASLRYEVPLPYIAKYQHEVSAGLDYKSSENSLAFNAAPTVNTPTEVFQFAAGYTGVLRDPWGLSSIGGQFYYSPGGVASKSSDFYYNKARFGATADYFYGRLQARRETSLPLNFSWVFNGTAQFANGNLIASEQLGVGGYSTVRGYDERQINLDEGWIISNELRTPAFRPLADWCKWGWADDRLQLLCFYDYGFGGNVRRLQRERHDWTLSSVGGGLRYAARKNLELRFDYGWQLNDLGKDGPPVRSRGHVAATVKF